MNLKLNPSCSGILSFIYGFMLYIFISFIQFLNRLDSGSVCDIYILNVILMESIILLFIEFTIYMYNCDNKCDILK